MGMEGGGEREDKRERQLGPTRGILLWSSVAQSLGQEQATESNCQTKMHASLSFFFAAFFFDLPPEVPLRG